MTNPYPYVTNLDIKYAPLEHFSLDALVGTVKDPWFNQTLVKVNESVVRVGVVQGEYHWHEHQHEDEFFFVLSGTLLIDLEPRADGVTPGRVITLAPHDGFLIPKGVRHRTRAPGKAVILMVEPATVVPTGS